MTMTTGQRIKQLRIEKGMTQEMLGEKVGVKKAAIYKYENGLVVNLKRDVIEKLANVLGVSPSFLMGLDDETLANASSQKDTLDEMLIAGLNGGKEYTKEELEEIRRFAEFVRSQRKK